MQRPNGSAGEERQANAVQQAAVAPVLRMEVLFLSPRLACPTQTLCVEKVRVNLQKIAHLRYKNSKNDLLKECLKISLPSSVLQFEIKVLK
jgi:hypothetical protein